MSIGGKGVRATCAREADDPPNFEAPQERRSPSDPEGEAHVARHQPVRDEETPGCAEATGCRRLGIHPGLVALLVAMAPFADGAVSDVEVGVRHLCRS